MNTAFFKKITKEGKLPLILLACASLGVLILALPQSDGGDDTSSAYMQTVKKEIELMSEKISGCDATVILSLSCGYTDLYARTSESGYGSKPTVSGRAEPVIRGVTVVCQNGDEPSVQAKITAAICCAYNIGQSRVYVCQGE